METQLLQPARIDLSSGLKVPLRVLWAGAIGTTLEFFDFIVYGTVSALVFNNLFFPNVSPASGTLLALSTFAVGFLARPLGAAIFGHLGDSIGRRKTLMLTLIIMGGATVLIGLLPTYQQIGLWAPILLTILRVIQGAAVGGEWGGAVLLIGEHTSNTGRGRSTSFAQLGSPAGLLLANGFVLAITEVTSREQFLAWGWRVPFVFSLVLVVLGSYLRSKVEETPVFRELQRDQLLVASPVLETFRSYWKRLLIAVGLTTVSFGGYYVFTTVGLAYLALKKLPSLGLYGTVIGAALSLPVILISGAISDHVGRRPMYLLSTILMSGLAIVFFMMFDTGSAPLIIGAIAAGLVSWSILFGVQGAFLPELFPPLVRYTGASLAYQLTGAIGGLVPVVSLGLMRSYDTPLAISGLVAATAVISLIALWVAPETAHS